MNCKEECVINCKSLFDMQYNGGTTVLETQKVFITENGKLTLLPTGSASGMAAVEITTEVPNISPEVLAEIFSRLDALEAWEESFEDLTSAEIDSIISTIS